MTMMNWFRSMVLARGAAIAAMMTQAFWHPSLRPAEWPPLKPRTLKARSRKERKGTMPLVESGTLVRSARVVSATNLAVTVGSARRAGR